MKNGYIGSVRFYKNLILLFVIVAILVPTGFAISYRISNKNLEMQISEMDTAMQELETCLEEKSETVQEERSVVEMDSPEYQELYPDFYAPESFAATERKEM